MIHLLWHAALSYMLTGTLPITALVDWAFGYGDLMAVFVATILALRFAILDRSCSR